jgi:hypothetical protein
MFLLLTPSWQYYTATDETTATNSGQGSLQITYSRGYHIV